MSKNYSTIKKGVAMVITTASLAALATATVNSAYAETNDNTNVSRKEITKLLGMPATAGNYTDDKGEKLNLDKKGELNYKADSAKAYSVTVEFNKVRKLQDINVKFFDGALVNGHLEYAGEDGTFHEFGGEANFTKVNEVHFKGQDANHNVYRAKKVRLVVTSTVNASGQADKAVAGVKSFNAQGDVIKAGAFTVKGLENLTKAYIGDKVDFTIKPDKADADVAYKPVVDDNLEVKQGKTDADGTTHFTLTVKHATGKVGTKLGIYDAYSNKDIVKDKTVVTYDTIGRLNPVMPNGNTFYIGDTINGGKGYFVTAEAVGVNGEEVEHEQAIKVTTDHPELLQITRDDKDKFGGVYVKALKEGNAKITIAAAHGNKSVTINTLVRHESVDNVTITSFPSEVVLGEKADNKIVAKATPDNAPQKFEFKSSDEKLLTVDANGVLTAHPEALDAKATAKTVTVTVSAQKASLNEEAKHVDLKVTVRRPYVKKVTVDAGVKDGAAITLGEATEKGIALKAGVDSKFALQDLTFKSSNEKVAAVDAAGNVKFTGEPGFVVITASSAHGQNGLVTAGVKLNVVRPKLEGFELFDGNDTSKDKKPLTTVNWLLGENRTLQLNAVATPKYADGKVYYTTGDATVADVNPATGLVQQGNRAGHTTITAISTVDGKVQARVNIENNFKPATGLEASLPAGVDAGKVQTGSAFKIGYTVLPAVGAEQKVEITSSDPSVVAVHDNTVTALKAGKATVTVVNGNFERKFELTVVQSDLDTLKAYKATYTDKAGKAVQVANFDASQDGNYTLPEGVDLASLKFVGADGKEVKPEVKVEGNKATVKFVYGKAMALSTFVLGKVAEEHHNNTTTPEVHLDHNIDLEHASEYHLNPLDVSGKSDTTTPSGSDTKVTLDHNVDLDKVAEYKLHPADVSELLGKGGKDNNNTTTTNTTTDKDKDHGTTTTTTDNKGNDGKNNTDVNNHNVAATFTAEELAALKKVQAQFKKNLTDKDDKFITVEGFDPTVSKTYTLDGAVGSVKVSNIPNGFKASIVYNDANGKVTEDKAKAVTAVVTLEAPSGAKVVYTFTAKVDATTPTTNTVLNDKDSSKQLGKTGVAVGIFATIGAVLAAAGVAIKRRFAR